MSTSIYTPGTLQIYQGSEFGYSVDLQVNGGPYVSSLIAPSVVNGVSIPAQGAVYAEIRRTSSGGDLLATFQVTWDYTGANPNTTYFVLPHSITSKIPANTAANPWKHDAFYKDFTTGAVYKVIDTTDVLVAPAVTQVP